MFDVGPSPLDVRLVAFRIPIRVHWSFWLMGILLGWTPGRMDIVFIWVMCLFFSFLVHELGHALTAHSFGWPSEIVLYFGGGVAISDRYRNNTAGRGMLVSIMGPAAGLLLFFLIKGVIIALMLYRVPVNQHVAIALFALRDINWYYTLFNLIPVVPLDGGHICYYICQILRLRDPYGITTKIGIAASGLAAYLFFKDHQNFGGSIMLMLCIQRVYDLQTPRR